MTVWEWIVKAFKNVSAIAVIAGGAWGLFNFLRGRTYSNRLQIDIKANSEASGDRRILFVEAVLTNAGKGKLQARRVTPEEYVYKDEHEELRCSCSLQLRRIELGSVTGEELVEWHESPNLEPIPNVPKEINLLEDYLVPHDNNRIAFWLEPGDVAQLSATIVVLPGHYLAKVSFYGTDAKEDYWSRQVYVHVA